MSKTLYRKYRSMSLDEIRGQSHITGILKRSIAKGNIAHAYLLTGPHGVGKTSIARILAHEINQLPYSEDGSHLDIIEIDAASNNGVDDIRDLRERVQLAPISASKKVYIIDEVHMLSKSAFNALLKTLEEPPEHIVFILATTNPDKMPETVISRTQHFAFRAISPRDAIDHLAEIAKKEKINIDDESLSLVAAHGQGSFRNSIGLLDQLSGLSDEKTGITRELVEQTLGLAPKELVESLLRAYETKQLDELVALLDESEQNGVDPSVLSSQLIAECRARIVTNPQLAHLIDGLLDVAKSSQPNIKLLTTLAAQAAPKPKSAALSVATASVSSPLVELEKQAVQKSPQESAVKSPAPKPAVKKKVKKTAASGKFDWKNLSEIVKADSVAVSSVLAKCSHEIDSNKLIIYAGNKFYKKKLDDMKYRSVLMEALEKAGGSDMIIDTIPTVCPPKDSAAASVAVIMGGGEEVSLEG